MISLRQACPFFLILCECAMISIIDSAMISHESILPRLCVLLVLVSVRPPIGILRGSGIRCLEEPLIILVIPLVAFWSVVEHV